MNKTIAIFALAAVTFAAIPAYATRFIYDVKLIGGTKSETDSLKSTYQAQGWKVIDKDLNSGCGGSSDYIYLLYKDEESYDNRNYGYITDLKLVQGYGPSGEIYEMFSRWEHIYNLVSYEGGRHFTELKGDLNSNTKGDVIHLYYTRSEFNDGDGAPSCIWFDENTSSVNGYSLCDAQPLFSIADDGSVVLKDESGDLNRGCGEGTDYIYMFLLFEDIGNSPWSGKGTSDWPFWIENEAGWTAAVNAVANGTACDRSYSLINDISISHMLGTSEHPFSGNFFCGYRNSGNHYKLTVNISGSEQGMAPFHHVKGATIEDVVVEGSVSSAAYHAAGLVGLCDGGTIKVSGCTVSANVNGKGYVGGIVGHGGSSSLTIENSVFSGTIGGYDNYAGGLLGWCDTATVTLRNDLFKGAFAPSSGGLSHPVACKNAGSSVAATAASVYYLNTVAPTATGNYVLPGIETLPVSETSTGQWNKPVTAADGLQYYAESVEFFVSRDNGNDANDGHSSATPFRTIQKAIESADSYDTIRVASGVYEPFDVGGLVLTIVGAGAESTVVDGDSGALTCAKLSSGTVLRGFRLQNGKCGASGGRLEDCIVENSTGAGTDCVALDNVDTRRCIVRNCSMPGGGIIVGGKHSNGLFYGHSARSVIDGATFYNCTIADNNALTSGDETGSVANAAAFYDCIAWNNNLVVNSQGSLSWDGNDEVDPKFVDATNGNYRLRVDSPAINADDGLYPDEVGETDLDGNPRVQNGKIDRGCYEIGSFSVTVEVTGRGSVSPMESAVFTHGSVTLTADTTPWGTTVIGWYTNGVMAAESGDTFTVEDVTEDIVVNVKFAVCEWYVSAETGNDANDGLTATSAVKTIQVAIDRAISGETIHVAAGRYSPIDVGGRHLTIVGNGASETIISGNEYDSYLALLSAQSVLKKFTLNGDNVENTPLQIGVRSGTLEDCIVECGRYQVALESTDTIRCIVRNCFMANGIQQGTHRNTLFYNLSGNSALMPLLQDITAYNCTIANNSFDVINVSSGGLFPSGGLSSGRFVNCICWGNLSGNDENDPLFVNPAKGDYRLSLDSPAINTGDSNFAGEAGETDLAGNTRVLDGAIDRGCYEGPSVEGALVTVEAFGGGTVSPSYIRSESPITATFTAEPNETGKLFFAEWFTNGVYVATTGNILDYPDTLTLSNVTGYVAMTVEIKGLHYVDAVSGDDSNDGQSWSSAFKTIQGAIDAASSNAVIYVKAGTYSPIDVGGRLLSIIGMGANVTVIDGGGTNRCAALSKGTTLEGFTLRNGLFGASDGTLEKCIIENCVNTGWGYVLSGANTHRCIVRNCMYSSTQHDNIAVGGGVHRDSLFYGINMTRGLIFSDATLYNCTVADNACTKAPQNTQVFNCILWGNSNSNDAEDPLFVGAPGGDYRLRAGSPAIDTGDSNYADEAGESDLAGNARVQGEKIDRGCYEGPGAEGLVCFNASADGGGAVTPTYVVTNAPATVTFMVDESGWGRPVVGWYTNGVLAAESGDTFTIVEESQDTKVVVRFASTNLFVNAATGSDENDGLTSGTAMRTIQRAVEIAAPYDTVYVAAGTYSPIDVGGRKHLTIIGAGKDVTIIDGGGSQRCAVLSDGTTLTGFSLRKGRASNSGSWGAGAQSGMLVDCLVEGCDADGYDSVLRDTSTRRCIVRGGFVKQVFVYGGNHYNSLFQGLGCQNVFKWATLYNCTVVNNQDSWWVGSDSLFYNCVLWGNWNGNDAETPLFVNADEGDFRLGRGSPAIDSGNPDYADEAGEIDLAGNARVQGGRIDRGCYEGGIEGFIASAKVEGCGAVSPDKAFVAASSGSALFTADTSAWKLPLLGWYTNGVWAAGEQNQFLLENIGEDVIVTVKFQAGAADFYVNGTSGDDANDGKSPARAMRTIQHAIDVSASNDTIRVASGTYGPIDVGGRVLTIIGTGADATAIDGGGKNRCAILAEGTTLRGFTLRNGYATGWTDNYAGETMDACVKFGSLEDCIVENCVGEQSAAVLLKTDMNRCIFRNCKAKECVVLRGVHKNSLFHRNQSSDMAILCNVYIYNCTIVDNSTNYASVLDGLLNVGRNSIYWNNTCHNGEADPYDMEDPQTQKKLDPMFVDAANGNFRLKVSSPFIERGAEEYVINAVGDCDLDGNPRIQGQAIDMGCYESPYTGGYWQWAKAKGLGAADEVTDGEYNLIRYAFDKPSGEFAAITNVYLNAAGRPVVQARVPENTEGVTLKVLSSGDLKDWSKAGWKELTVESGGTLVFEDDTDPQRFYRLKAE